MNLNTTPYLMSRRTVFFLDTSASESCRGGGAELISVLRMLFLHCTLTAGKMIISGRRFTAVLVRGLPLVAELNHYSSDWDLLGWRSRSEWCEIKMIASLLSGYQRVHSRELPGVLQPQSLLHHSLLLRTASSMQVHTLKLHYTALWCFRCW